MDAALSAMPTNPALNARDLQMRPEEVARQFEAVLVRQMLTETMKPLLEGGHSGQVYGYFISEALADSFTKAGGFGLQSVLQTQLYEQRARELKAAEEKHSDPSAPAGAGPAPSMTSIRKAFLPK